jgi:hypothetical protein
MSLQSFPIVGLTKGLKNDVKSAMLPDQAWAVLENSYTFRERELKREGKKFLGRLRRAFVGQSLGTTPAGPPPTITLNIFALSSITEPQAEIQSGSLVITVGAPDTATFTDLGNGTFAVTGDGVAAGSFINYITGVVVLNFTTLTGGSAITATFGYFPTLPVMGIPQREIPAINDEQTIWFDTKYAYSWNGVNFQEFIPGTTWAGTDADLFWSINYRGSSSAIRLLFTTNDSLLNPIRYTDGVTWTDFAPLLTDINTHTSLFQCLMLIPYYGRLLALNTWEGVTSVGASTSTNFFARCRYSQLGDPTDQTLGWRVDIFGRGGIADAPVNEQIIGATFVKNTLVVDFEKSTWQLRYQGENGTPFIWERVSADFGGESTFSGVLFDNHRLSVGDKAITGANSISVNRIDGDIPNQVFLFQNINNGVERITGIRDYKRELVFWNYPDSQTQAAIGVPIKFPNKVLVYNYRNNTWAIFRDSITAFGTFQSGTSITWDSLETFWDDDTVLWDDPDTQSLFPIIVCGDQQGFISCYGYPSPSQQSTVQANDQETLTIQAINLSVTPIVVTSVNNGLIAGEIVYLSNMNFVNSTTFLPILPIDANINNQIYQVQPIDANTFQLYKWDFQAHRYLNNFAFTPAPATSLYVGGGRITLFPKMNLLSKDINIYQGKSLQTKLSRLDFLMQSVPLGSVTVKLFLNSSASGSTPGEVGNNNLVWNSHMSIDASPPFYTPGSDYAWFRYYVTLSAQYFSINITYDDNQMNTLSTHSNAATLYGINAWCRPGGKNVF